MVLWDEQFERTEWLQGYYSRHSPCLPRLLPQNWSANFIDKVAKRNGDE